MVLVDDNARARQHPGVDSFHRLLSNYSFLLSKVTINSYIDVMIWNIWKLTSSVSCAKIAKIGYVFGTSEQDRLGIHSHRNFGASMIHFHRPHLRIPPRYPYNIDLYRDTCSVLVSIPFRETFEVGVAVRSAAMVVDDFVRLDQNSWSSPLSRYFYVDVGIAVSIVDFEIAVGFRFDVD